MGIPKSVGTSQPQKWPNRKPSKAGKGHFLAIGSVHKHSPEAAPYVLISLLYQDSTVHQMHEVFGSAGTSGLRIQLLDGSWGRR